MMAFSFQQFFGINGQGFAFEFSIAKFPFFQIIGSMIVASIIAPFLRIWIRNNGKIIIVGFTGLLFGYYFPYFVLYLIKPDFMDHYIILLYPLIPSLVLGHFAGKALKSE